MVQLARIEAEDKPSSVGGFLCVFDAETSLSVTWVSKAPIGEVLEAAKHYAAVLVDALQKRGRDDLVRWINWASVTAAIAELIRQWNKTRVADLHREAGHDDAGLAARVPGATVSGDGAGGLRVVSRGTGAPGEGPDSQGGSTPSQ